MSRKLLVGKRRVIALRLIHRFYNLSDLQQLQDCQGSISNLTVGLRRKVTRHINILKKKV